MSNHIDNQLTKALHRIAAAHVPLDTNPRNNGDDPNASAPPSSEMQPVSTLRTAGGDRRRSVALVAAAVAAVGIAGLVAVASRSGPATTPADRPPPPANTELGPTSTIDNVAGPAPTAHLSAEELFVAATLAPDQAEIDSYDRAVAAHRTSCMADAGFTDPPEQAPLAATADIYRPMVDFLYFDDTAKIAQYGYNWPDRLGTSVGTREQQPKVNPEMSAALDRCNQPVIAVQQQARRANNIGDVTPDVIDGQIFHRVNSRPEVEAKYADWKVCMSNAGYPSARLREPVAADETRRSTKQRPTHPVARQRATRTPSSQPKRTRWPAGSLPTTTPSKHSTNSGPILPPEPPN